MSQEGRGGFLHRLEADLRGFSDRLGNTKRSTMNEKGQFLGANAIDAQKPALPRLSRRGLLRLAVTGGTGLAAAWVCRSGAEGDSPDQSGVSPTPTVAPTPTEYKDLSYFTGEYEILEGESLYQRMNREIAFPGGLSAEVIFDELRSNFVSQDAELGNSEWGSLGIDVATGDGKRTIFPFLTARRTEEGGKSFVAAVFFQKTTSGELAGAYAVPLIPKDETSVSGKKYAVLSLPYDPVTRAPLNLTIFSLPVSTEEWRGLSEAERAQYEILFTPFGDQDPTKKIRVKTPHLAKIMPVLTPEPEPNVDYESVRREIGELTTEERRLLSPFLVERLDRFTAGDNVAYISTDVEVFRAVREGKVYEIGGAYFDWDKDNKAVGYVVFDKDTGESQILGWVDEDVVIETGTKYELDVRRGPGVSVEQGLNGERFYTYGWEAIKLRMRDGLEKWRILPTPIIEDIRFFYDDLPEFIDDNSELFANAVETLRSEGTQLATVDWKSGEVQEKISEWVFQADVVVALPDSGTVDIRDESLRRVVEEGKIKVGHPELARATQEQLLYPFYYPQGVNDNFNRFILVGFGTFLRGKTAWLRIDPTFRGAIQTLKEEPSVVRMSPDFTETLARAPQSLDDVYTHEFRHMGELDLLYPMTGSLRIEPLNYMHQIRGMVADLEQESLSSGDRVWYAGWIGDGIVALLNHSFPSSR